MDYEKAYREALAHAREIHRNEVEKRRDMEWLFPELKESEDEKIRKEFCEDIWTFIPNEKAHKYIAWLEKQGESYTKRDVDDDYLKGICDAKHELEKQGEQKPAEWSEEDEDNYKRILEILHDCHAYGRYDLRMDEHAALKNWLKSLKGRVQPQTKQEWSEEDEQYLLVCKNALAKYQTTDK